MDFSNLESMKDEILLKALSNSLFKTNYSFDEGIEWNEVFEESRKQAVCSLVFDGLGSNANISKELSDKWFTYAMMYLKNNITVNANHSFLDKLMKKHGISYCILKGTASEFYYPNPSLRAMGDVDFIVPKESFEKASEILIEEGFSMEGEEHICHRVFKKGKIHLEMHFEPAGMPEGENRKNLEEYFEDIFQKASFVTLEGVQFENPSPFHHGLIMLLHTYHHLLSEGVGLRHLCDWAVFVNSFTNEEFVEIFEEKLCRAGLWKFSRILSATAWNYIGLPYREWIGDVDKTLCKDVISDIFAGGNFGNKEKSRVQQGAMISDRGKNGVKKNKLIQLINYKNQQAAKYHPFFQKHPIFYPFGFVFLAVRYTVYIITGKRKALNIAALTAGAEKRKNIYMQFGLFEKED